MTDVRKFKVGVQLEPQATTVDGLRAAWRAADELGLDSVWTWDHLRPVRGDVNRAHVEGWTQPAAVAVETSRARIGVLVTCAAYRNPDLLADMARTVDHLSGGRVDLGLGAGWYGQEFRHYGYKFGNRRRSASWGGGTCCEGHAKTSVLNPPPIGPMPLMIGGGGERKSVC